MKNRTVVIWLLGLALFLGLNAAVQGQIVYKIPGGVFPMDWNKSGFKGTLMLEKDSPSGIFIAFPNEGETPDDLRERAARFLAPMVVHDTKDKATIPFEVRSIPSHKGDLEDRGRYYFVKGEKSSAQILFFERKTPAAVVLYGYFASRSNDENKSKIWVDENLKTPKILSKFIGSFHVE